MEEIFFLVFFVLGDFDMLNEVDKDLSFLVSLISVTMSIRISFNINLRTLPFFSAASTVTCCCCQSNSKTVTLRFYWHLSARSLTISSKEKEIKCMYNTISSSVSLQASPWLCYLQREYSNYLLNEICSLLNS
jgi:hypothetical protein